MSYVLSVVQKSVLRP